MDRSPGIHSSNEEDQALSVKSFSIIVLLAALATAVVSWNPLVSFEVSACAASLVVGFVWRRVLPTLLAGLLLYPALAIALARVFPVALSFLASGLFVIVACEKLTFEYDVSAVLGSQTGIDTETRSLASEVSKAHTKKILVYVALAAIIMVSSAVVSDLTVYAPELTAAAILLFLTIYIYVTR